MRRVLVALACCLLVASTAAGQAKNRAPKANPGGPYTAIIGQALVVDGSASTDEDGYIAKYHWTASNGYEVWALDTPQGALIFPNAGSYSLKLVVVDNRGAASTGVSTTVTVGTPPPPPPPPPPPVEVCGDGIDNDGDGLIDEGCTPPPPPPSEICGDGIDNDGDGLIDEDCAPPPPPPPSGVSPDGTVVPPASSITDASGNVWTLGPAPESAPTMHYLLCNGELAPGAGYVSAIRYVSGVVQWFGLEQVWWPATCAAPPSSGGGGTPPPSDVLTTQTKTLVFIPDPDEYESLVKQFVMRVTDAAGVVVTLLDVGKPPVDASGQAFTPVSLSLVAGRIYTAAVEACSDALCGVFSAEASFVF